MTAQLIRMQAREVAGIFYEQNQRTLRFRRENPDQDKYVADHWPHFVDIAISNLTASLHDQTMPQHMKDDIYEVICRHWDQSQSQRAQHVLQATLGPRDRDDVRHVDANPQLVRARA